MQDDFYDKGFILKYCAATMVICYVLGQWIITQMIAADCDYNDLLSGIYLPLGHIRIYQPLAHLSWNKDPVLMQVIPHVLRGHTFWLWGMIFLGLAICYFINKKYEVLSSHGTAEFAKAKDIKAMGLTPKDSGVVIGSNPFDNTLLLDDGPAHVFLAAPTRTGKGIGIIIPTGIIWQHSMFFFDPKAELWTATAGYRKNVLGQKVMKFEPLCKDGSSASWNPYAEINFQSFEEMSDVKTINEMMVKTGEGSNKDPFWDNSAITLLNGVVLHLLYKNCQEKRELPCPTDAMSFISSPTMDTDHLYSSMKIYPHISPEEFLEEPYYEQDADEKGNPKTDAEGKPVYKKDKDGNPIPMKDEKGQPLCRKNPLKEIYGPYVPDLKPFVEALRLSKQETAAILDVQESNPEKKARIAFENLRQAIVRHKDMVDWKAPDIMMCSNKAEIDGVLAMDKQHVFYQLLVHPKVAECAANIVNNAKETRESIIGSAKTALSLYQDPLIKRNTAVSDFCFKDLLNPQQAVSLYLVLQPNDVEKLRPLTRLFVNTMLAKTVRDMKFDVPAEKKQRLLLMLDEFPQLKKMETIENTLAICAGYGVKICTVVQSITQINQIYTKDNSILDNSQIQIYMTPSNIQQAKELSEIMGDKTIREHNQSGKGLADKSTSESKISRKLMNPDEIMRMSKKKELVMVQGAKPILAKKIQWFNVPFFKKRVYDPQHGNKGGIPNPQFSDVCTEVKTYEELFRVHAPEVADVLEKQAAVTKARKAAKKKENPPASPVAPQAAAQPAVPAQNRETRDVEKETVTHAENEKASDMPQPSGSPATEAADKDRGGEDRRSTADTHHEEPGQAHPEAQQVATSQQPADVHDGHPEEKRKDSTESSKPDTSDESDDPAVLKWLSGRKKKQDVHDGHPVTEKKEGDEKNGSGEEGA